MVEEGSGAVYGHCTPPRRLNLKPSKVLVLGAGIVGAASALSLQRDGHAVTLIDRDDPGQGCSFGNAGIIARYSVVPLASHATPRKLAKMLFDPLGPLSIRWRYLPRLLPWLVRFAASARPPKLAASAAALAALQQHTLEAYRALLDQVEGRDVVRSNGLLHPYESEENYAGDAAERALRRQHGVTMQELTGDEAREIVPALAPSIKRATLLPDCAHTVNPLRLVQVLVQDLLRRGGRFRRTLVTAVEANASNVTVHTDSEQYSGDAVVVAFGAWSRRIAADLGSPVPLDTERGYHVVIPRSNVELDLPVLFPEYKFGATSMEMGLRLAGTVELASLDAPPNYQRARVLLRHGHRLFPGLTSDEYSEWMGLRPTLPDSLPVISRSPRHANVYYAFGHHHLGLTLAPITGRLIADMVAQRQTPIDLAPYRIDRF